MPRILAYLIYPFLLVGGYLIYFSSLAILKYALISASLAIVLMTTSMYFIEMKWPFRKDWEPSRSELIVDIFFYNNLVQVLFPVIIYLSGFYILKYLGFEDGVVLNVWPNEWPVFYQLILFCFVGEFFFYWWHRLAHTYPLLWSIHSIHHLPNKLYSLNTVRFHFLDKLVEFTFAIYLFYILGAKVDLICVYYIFFVATGLIQHCNLDLKLGLFDYLIASGETHRFHHDQNIAKSQCNYANNLVVWDLVFQTFKRESGTCPEIVGAAHYKGQDIYEETMHPFKYFSQSLYKLILSSVMKGNYRKFVLPMIKCSNNPELIQNKLLNKIISENSKTKFGIRFHFDQIKSVSDFKKTIPISDYEFFRADIESLMRGEVNVLTFDHPHYFNKTSGTTGKPKYLPVNMETQNNYLRYQKILSTVVFFYRKDAFIGKVFTVVGNVAEEVVNDKWTAGAMSGKANSMTPSYIKRKYAVDDKITRIQNLEIKNLYLAATALLSPTVSIYLSPNPTTFLKLLEVINTQKEKVLEVIASDPEKIFSDKKININYIKKILDLDREIQVSDFWPRLQVAVMWTGGSCSYLIPRVKNKVGDNVEIVELGYLSSEFFGTICIDVKNSLQIPTLQDQFFEFIKKDDYENGIRETILLHELVQGEDYYIIVTTPSGLYRYFINDIVRVSGFFNKTPCLNFVQKGKGVTNITGEKITEWQVVSFFDEHKDLLGDVIFFICLADQEKLGYTMYLEFDEKKASSDLLVNQIENLLDNYLKRINVEYESKVASGRLIPVKVKVLVSGTADDYKKHCMDQGQREAQLKFLHLQYKNDLKFDFDKRAVQLKGSK